MDTRIKVAIVDDHTLFRQGLSLLLSATQEVNVIFDADNGKAMMQKLNKNELPDLVLVDIDMPVMDGFLTTAWLRAHHPGISVLALSMFEDDRSIIGMLRNGAGGYLLKETRGAELVQAIKTVVAEGYYLNNQVSGKLLHNIQNKQVQQFNERFSANERKFLELCCSELTYKEIAGQMNLSPHTIDNYREAFFQEFDIRSRTGLAIFAIKNNLVTL
jgi:DNA-binding NarL/FixJ family response regulator